MPTLEKEVENYLKTQVEKRGGLCLKYPATFREGIPDRIVILHGGCICFVELKRPKGGTLEETQKYWIGRLRKLGCRVEVIKNKAEVDSLLNELSALAGGV